jgi:hypothetical protein
MGYIQMDPVRSKRRIIFRREFLSRIFLIDCKLMPFYSTDLVATFPTKRTPIINVQFTPRNLCLVAGPYLAPEQR